ncbi:hypothetical protein BZA05DRAFT_438916 [Tricharina praecox]|uniref:uncharacterized protein n=1 Tax=Tricharina praecox TaxID=43433 RepID=UPI002220B70C|nr:uncharacterized protein BZA05DRAFT_438916 [Tricharina praecox]KAI5844282.1 hypothetical protein BZA05DRAFT_438916 [Tricharina praecox]
MQFSIKCLAIVLAGFAAVASALPGSRRDDNDDDYEDSRVARVTGCSLDRAVMPTIQQDGYAELSSPSPRTPKRVVLGKGTQNYTCSTSTASVAPAAYGAYALLYDASCLAQNFPAVLHSMPAMLLAMEEKKIRALLGLCSIMGDKKVEVGLHYFTDATTPVFEFTKSGSSDIFVGKKTEGVPAPSAAPQGDHGAVDWLRLSAIEGTRGFSDVYRVNTAGGMAPRTCEGMPAKFEIPYATEYWFF